MDPMTMTMAALFGGSSPANSSATTVNTPTFDSSGWNVNFGAGSIESARAQTPLPTGASTNNVNAYLPYVLVGLGLLVAWRMVKNKR
jgi:hypothetical protein